MTVDHVEKPKRIFARTPRPRRLALWLVVGASVVITVLLVLVTMTATTRAQDERREFAAPGGRGICVSDMSPQGISAASGGGAALAAAPAVDSDGVGGGGAPPPPPREVGTPMPMGTSAPSSVTVQPQAPLRAGVIDDNAQWDDYLLYRNNTLQEGLLIFNDVNITDRHIIRVADQNGWPVVGATIRVQSNGTTVQTMRTTSNGSALFFPNAAGATMADSYDLLINKDGQALRSTIQTDGGQRDWWVQFGAELRAPANLDVLFLIDTTGSMGDEIAELQANIARIADAVSQLESAPSVRYGMVTYKDRGDEYVVCRYAFTDDVSTFQSDLSQISAGGGGDTPESLNEGLHNAVQQVEWRLGNTVSLVFLVADAAPQLNYPNDYNYAEEMQQAAQRGIKVYPIASSGLEPQGEYILRQIAQYTGGKFIFLTYDGGTPGTPGDERPDLSAGADPSNFTVSALDDLVLQLITDELHNTTRVITPR
jgi:uncharacterized protein YegL